MSIYEEISYTVVSLCRESGLTQEWLALECEISVSYLCRIEYGTANPTINELWCIAKVLGIELRNPFVVPDLVGAAP